MQEKQVAPYRGADGSLAAPVQLQSVLSGGVLTLALDREAVRNAIDAGLASEMQQVLEAAARDPDVRVVVLKGQGDGFCAGLDAAHDADPGGVDTHSPDGVLAVLHHCRSRLLPLMPQPVIAMVHGYCAGEALGLVEACDIAYAAHDTVFVASTAETGAALSASTAKSMSRSMAPRAASFHALSGRPFDGPEAERAGLVTRSVPAGELQAEVDALAAELAAKDPLALRFTKETLLHVGSMDWDAVLDFNAAKFAQLKALQAGRPSTRAALVESFLAGKSKPGLGG